MANVSMMIEFERDVDAPLVPINVGTLLMQGDQEANTVKLTVTKDGAPYAMDGVTALLLFRRADGITVRNAAIVEGNIVTAKLVRECYNVIGSFAAILRVTSASEKRTFLRLTGYVENEGDGALIDPSGTIPGYDDLQRIFDELETGLAEAAEATGKANGAAGAANASAGKADIAATRANKAAENIENISATAQGVPFGQPAGALATKGTAGWEFAFDIPAGEKGGVLTQTEIQALIDASVEAAIKARAEIEHPVKSLWLTEGTEHPFDVLGVGASRDSWQLIADRYLLGAGGDYQLGQQGIGEKEHVLTEQELPKISGNLAIHNGQNGTPFAFSGGIISGSKTDKWANLTSISTVGATSLQNLSINFGGGKAHNNLPPSFVVNIWQRIN